MEKSSEHIEHHKSNSSVIKKLFMDLEERMQEKQLSIEHIAETAEREVAVMHDAFRDPEKCTLDVFLGILCALGVGMTYFDIEEYMQEKEDAYSFDEN